MASTTPSATRPPPLDLTHFFSRTAKRRHPSEVKRFYKYFAIPGIQNLAGGLPNSNYFPYDTLEGSVALPNRFKPTPVRPVDPPTDAADEKSVAKGPEAAKVLVPHDSAAKDLLNKIDLTTALQYGQAQGYPPLYGFVRAFAQLHMHPNVPYAGGPEIILTCGSTDGFSKVLDTFTNIWDEERDWIRDREGVLCEQYAYMNAIQAARPRGLNIVPVAIDDEGMLAHGPGGLADVLENWDVHKGKRPHLIYTVTVGQNPTSGVLSLARRKALYAICQKYDILICEDDPYWFLQYPSANTLSMKNRGHPVSANVPTEPYNYNTASGGKSSGFPFLDSLVPSYLSVDTDGRVIRLDTFSKSVAPGCRLGFITTQSTFVDALLRATESSTQQPSGFVQSMVAQLLQGPPDVSGEPGRGGSKDGSGWKVDGWVRWIEGLRGNYERRMQTMSTILDNARYLVQHATNSDGFEVVSKTQLFDFQYPMGGMFLWLRVHYNIHPLHAESLYMSKGKFTGPELAQAFWLFLTKDKYKVLVAPGGMFAPTDEVRASTAWQYQRLCFAAVDENVVKASSHGFVNGIRDFWALGAKEIESLLREIAQPDLEALHIAQQGQYMMNPAVC